MSSQRNSRPRTSKESDHADKGKGKEKRPVEDEEESGSDLELEEDPIKAKEDEERKAEIHHKRSEDTLRFNVIPGMKESKGRIIETLMKRATSPLRSRPYLEKVQVRGVEVDFSAKAINKAYFDDDDADATKYLAK
ncbi:hypothetical protein HAX54_020396, partial [Datura stramonium]|nr:hypothetical protein [Datura stramonium]